MNDSSRTDESDLSDHGLYDSDNLSPIAKGNYSPPSSPHDKDVEEDKANRKKKLEANNIIYKEISYEQPNSFFRPGFVKQAQISQITHEPTIDVFGNSITSKSFN